MSITPPPFPGAELRITNSSITGTSELDCIAKVLRKVTVEITNLIAMGHGVYKVRTELKPRSIKVTIMYMDLEA